MTVALPSSSLEMSGIDRAVCRNPAINCTRHASVPVLLSLSGIVLSIRSQRAEPSGHCPVIRACAAVTSSPHLMLAVGVVRKVPSLIGIPKVSGIPSSFDDDRLYNSTDASYSSVVESAFSPVLSPLLAVRAILPLSSGGMKLHQASVLPPSCSVAVN